MKKIILLSFMLVAWCAAMVAAPVKNMPVKRVQPKGDTLYCYASGDEFYNWLHDAEGYTIVQHPETGYYVYAMSASDGTLSATSYVAGSVDPASLGMKPWLMPSSEVLRKKHDAWKVPAEMMPVSPKTVSCTPLLNNIVVFVRFSDESSLTTEPFSTVDAMFNDSSASANSMYNYFKRSSYGRLHIPTYYYPAPSGNTVLSYQDTFPRSYYQPYNATTNTNGYTDDNDSRLREFSLWERVVNWVNTNCPVDNSLNLDVDNDGMVDNICFVVSGTYTGWSDLLWPHKWSLYDRTVTMNGKRVYTFNLQLAGSGSHYFSASTFCHEMTHTLGAPDIYHYNEYTNVSPGGSWDLMNSNSTPPQQTNALFKLKYTRWIDSIPEITDSGSYTLFSNASGPNNAYKIRSANRNQWYILEYRNNADTFDNSIPNRGLLIWRYNMSSSASNASYSATTPHELWLFRPGSNCDSVNGNVSQASFGVAGRTSFTATSNPHPYLCDGTPDTTISITNISISGDGRSVSFRYSPAGAPQCSTVTAFPLTQDFETDLGCWDYSSADPANDDRIGLDMSGNNAHGGQGCFVFSSYSRATDYNQWLISPRLQPNDQLRLRFYYKKSNSSPEQFRVLASATGKATSNFTDTLATFNVTTSAWQLCDLLVPLNTRYVAIDYYSNYQYYLYVDDIVLSDTAINQHDTTYLHIHDTLVRTVYDTVVSYFNDTVYYTIVDTATHMVYDTNYVELAYKTLTVVPNQANRGRAAGSGTFPEGSVVEICAIPREGFEFVRWQDNNRDNPRQVTVRANMTYSAYFQAVGGKMANNILVHDTIVVRDTTWITVHDTIYMTFRDTIRIPHQLHDTVWVEQHGTIDCDTTTYFTLAVSANDASYGFAIGNGRFPAGTEVELAAVPFTGYRLRQWSNGETEDIINVTLTSDQSVSAIFEVIGSESIEVAEQDSCRIYAEGKSLVVEHVAGEQVVVYNAMGQRMVCVVPQGEHMRMNMPSSGLYLVKVGGRPAQKVIVLK